MKIQFNKTMCQMYRSIIPLIGPIVDAGHELKIEVHDRRIDFEKMTKDHHDISTSAPECIGYMANNFGIKLKNLVPCVRNNSNADLYLNRYGSRMKKKLPKKTIAVPFHYRSTITQSGEVLTGNPICELIKNSLYAEIPGKVLIMHTGGARGYFSERDKSAKRSVLRENNLNILSKVISNLGFTSRITIKTHPTPYRGCTKRDLINDVLPGLEFDGEIEVVDNDLIRHIKEAEFILGFGTSAWNLLAGSKKKVVNVLGVTPYKDNRERRWEEKVVSLKYDELVRMQDIKFKHLSEDVDTFNLPAIDNIMKLINRG